MKPCDTALYPPSIPLLLSPHFLSLHKINNSKNRTIHFAGLFHYPSQKYPRLAWRSSHIKWHFFSFFHSDSHVWLIVFFQFPRGSGEIVYFNHAAFLQHFDHSCLGEIPIGSFSVIILLFLSLWWMFFFPGCQSHVIYEVLVFCTRQYEGLLALLNEERRPSVIFHLYGCATAKIRIFTLVYYFARLTKCVIVSCNRQLCKMNRKH